jgi:hypothetical protein
MLDLGRFAELGRNGDDTIGHLTTGERIIPNGVLGQELTNKIIREMQASGLDPSQYVVGNENNSFNPATGQPEFALEELPQGTSTEPLVFDFGEVPQGKRGKATRFQMNLKPFLENQAQAIANLTQQQVPTSTNMGTTLGGSAELSPQMRQFVDQNVGQAGLWNSQVGQQLGQAQVGSNQLQDAYSSFGDSQYNTRQGLENLFMDQAGMQANQNNMFNNSALASLIGGSGGGSNTYAGAGALQGANNLANQQLRIGAYQGAQNAFNTEIENLQRMLTGASGLETAGLERADLSQEAFNANLGNMGDIQDRQLNQLILGRGLGDDATNFQMNRLAGVIGSYNPQLEFAAAKAAQAKKPGFGLSNILSTAAGAASGYVTGGWGGAAAGGLQGLSNSYN